MATADFEALDAADDANPRPDSVEPFPDNDTDSFIGKTAVPVAWDGYFVFDCNTGGPITGDFVTSARIHFELDQDTVGFFGVAARIYEMDPTHTYNDWYETDPAVPGAIWRGAHHQDMDVVSDVAVEGVSIDNTGIGSTTDSIDLLRYAPLSGQTLGAGNQIGSLITYFWSGGASRRIQTVDVKLKRFGTWDGTETVTATLWSVKSGGGGKYNLEPDAIGTNGVLETRNVLGSISPSSYTTKTFSNGNMPIISSGRQYILVLSGNWTPNGDKYVSALTHGNADGNNENVNGSDCALMIYGEEKRLNRHLYPDALTLRDTVIDPAPSFQTYVSLGTDQAGDVLTGGAFGDFGSVFTSVAMARAGWDADSRYGVLLHSGFGFTNHQMYPSFQSTGGGRAVPFLRLAWSPQPNGVIDTPAASSVTIDAGESLSFTGTGTDPDGNSMTYLWDFDSSGGSGIANSTDEDPGSITWENAGTFTVTFTVTNSVGAYDNTPATMTVVVLGGAIDFEADAIQAVDFAADGIQAVDTEADAIQSVDTIAEVI